MPLKKKRNHGCYNPADAAEGTIRNKFALSIDKNTVHGSDAVETAKQNCISFQDHA